MGNIKTTSEEKARARYLRHVRKDRKKQRKYLLKILIVVQWGFGNFFGG